MFKEALLACECALDGVGGVDRSCQVGTWPQEWNIPGSVRGGGPSRALGQLKEDLNKDSVSGVKIWEAEFHLLHTLGATALYTAQRCSKSLPWEVATRDTSTSAGSTVAKYFRHKDHFLRFRRLCYQAVPTNQSESRPSSHPTHHLDLAIRPPQPRTSTLEAGSTWIMCQLRN